MVYLLGTDQNKNDCYVCASPLLKDRSLILYSFCLFPSQLSTIYMGSWYEWGTSYDNDIFTCSNGEKKRKLEIKELQATN